MILKEGDIIYFRALSPNDSKEFYSYVGMIQQVDDDGIWALVKIWYQPIRSFLRAVRYRTD